MLWTLPAQYVFIYASFLIITRLAFSIERDDWSHYRWQNRDRTNMNKTLKKEYKESLNE